MASRRPLALVSGAVSELPTGDTVPGTAVDLSGLASLYQALDATLTALAGLATGANKFPYSTGTDTFSQADITAAGRALLDDADAAAQIVTLGLAALFQPLASKLTDIAALTATSGNVITGNGTTWVSSAPSAPAFSARVETIASSSSLTGDSASGATQVGVCTALTSDAAVNAPSNGTVGAPYRYILTASGGARVCTPTGFAGSTDNGTGAAISVPSGKTISIFAQYIGSSGWLYGGYELLQ
jgi:hypothetical protein